MGVIAVNPFSQRDTEQLCGGTRPVLLERGSRRSLFRAESAETMARGLEVSCGQFERIVEPILSVA